VLLYNETAHELIITLEEIEGKGKIAERRGDRIVPLLPSARIY